MGFKTQFKSGRGVDISEVWWEGVREVQRPKAPDPMVDKWTEEKESSDGVKEFLGDA